ncbi:MAG: site-specific DNA-methyltransferase, partial [Chloroflexota bacterium]
MYSTLREDSGEEYCEMPVPPQALDHVLLTSSQHMSHLPDNSVHLMVTSPPYNAGKDYDQDLTLGEYVAFLSEV